MKKLIIPSVVIAGSIITTGVAYADAIPEKNLTDIKPVLTSNDVKSAIKLSPVNKKLKANLDQYKITHVEKDKQGFKHYTLTPEVNGIKALDAEIKVHTDKNGTVTYINGDLNQKRLAPSNKIILSKDDAINKAFNQIGYNRYEVKNLNNSDVVKFNDLTIDEKTNRYVYNMRIIYVSPKIETWDMTIDAENGEIHYKRNLAESTTFAPSDSAIGTNGTPAMGRCLSIKGLYRPLNIFKSNVDNRYWLSNQANTTLLETYDVFSTDVARWKVMSSDSTIFRSET